MGLRTWFYKKNRDPIKAKKSIKIGAVKAGIKAG